MLTHCGCKWPISLRSRTFYEYVMKVHAGAACYQRSTAGSRKGLTRRTCKRQRHCWRNYIEAKTVIQEHRCLRLCLRLFPHNLGRPPTKAAILNAYLEFVEKASNPDDRVFVFFAGHGMTKQGLRRPIGYLVPVDGNSQNLSHSSGGTGKWCDSFLDKAHKQSSPTVLSAEHEYTRKLGGGH